MAITSTRSVVTAMSGDLSFGQTLTANSNTTAPGHVTRVVMTSSQNVISPPELVTGVSFNLSPTTYLWTLMGSSGDFGVALKPGEPCSLGLNSTAPFILASTGITLGQQTIIFVWT